MKSPFLRQFPGKTRYQRVSEDDWNAPLPHRDIAGFGHILRLEADVRVWSPAGDLVSARKWPSRSYIRNFARIFRNMFGQNVQLVDTAGNLRTVALNNTDFGNGGILIPGLVPFNGAQVGQAQNPELSGAAMGIGNGVFVANHQANDLVNRVGGIVSSRNNVRTSVQTTATVTLEITTGITNSQAASINVTEIALFMFVSQLNAAPSSVPFATMLAHDGISITPVAAGGVIAPRYTMDFPI